MQQTDFLTGFFGKESMYVMLDKLKAESDVDHKPFTALLLDMDHFRMYNEKFGHLEGDNMLKYFAGTLRATLEDEKTIDFRFGGDEFIVVFPGKKAHEVYHIARNIMTIFRRRPFLMKGRLYKLHFSAGIAVYPADGAGVEEVIHKADKAMYFSKTHGRARITIYSHILHKKMIRVVVIVTCLLLSAAGLWYFIKSPYMPEFMHWLKQRTGKMEKLLIRRAVKLDEEDLDLVYLRSGRVLKGSIIRDDANEVELSLSLEAGSGSTIVKKANIKRIEKRQAKTGE
jgi:diguanylate cyclase (GGDEF)-like protein